MKIVKSKGDTFDFKLSGTETLTITPEGITVTDEIATILNTRCGVIIENVPEAEVVSEAPVKQTEEVITPVEEAPVEPVAEATE